MKIKKLAEATENIEVFRQAEKRARIIELWFRYNKPDAALIMKATQKVIENGAGWVYDFPVVDFAKAKMATLTALVAMESMSSELNCMYEDTGKKVKVTEKRITEYTHEIYG